MSTDTRELVERLRRHVEANAGQALIIPHEHAVEYLAALRSPAERGEGETLVRRAGDVFRAWHEGHAAGTDEAATGTVRLWQDSETRAWLYPDADLLASPPAPVEPRVCSWCGVEVAETNEENACPLCVRHYGLTPPHAEEEHPRSFVTDEVREQAGAPAPPLQGERVEGARATPKEIEALGRLLRYWETENAGADCDGEYSAALVREFIRRASPAPSAPEGEG